MKHSASAERFERNFKSVLQDYRRLGRIALAAGMIAFFVPASENIEPNGAILLAVIGLIFWAVGVFARRK